MKNLVTPLGYDRLFDSFELSLKADGLRPHTISCYIRDVRRFWGYAQPQDPRSVTADQIREFVTSLRDQLAPKTVHAIQIGLRRFFKFLIAEGELESDPSQTVSLRNRQIPITQAQIMCGHVWLFESDHTLSICRLICSQKLWHTASHRRSPCMAE